MLTVQELMIYEKGDREWLFNTNVEGGDCDLLEALFWTKRGIPWKRQLTYRLI